VGNCKVLTKVESVVDFIWLFHEQSWLLTCTKHSSFWKGCESSLTVSQGWDFLTLNCTTAPVQLIKVPVLSCYEYGYLLVVITITQISFPLLLLFPIFLSIKSLNHYSQYSLEIPFLFNKHISCVTRSLEPLIDHDQASSILTLPNPHQSKCPVLN
jgi:hypothetical protein